MKAELSNRNGNRHGGKLLLCNASIYEYWVSECRADGKTFLSDPDGREEFIQPKDPAHGREGLKWFRAIWLSKGIFDKHYNNGHPTDICREQYPDEPLKWVAEEDDYLHKESYHGKSQAWNRYSEEYYDYMGHHKPTR